MKNLGKLILLFSLMTSSSHAEDIFQKMRGLKVFAYSKLGHENDEYEAIVTEDKADHFLKIINKKGESVLTDSYPILTDAFREMRSVDIGDKFSPYIIVTTQRGIHGENLLLYSLVNRKLVKNFTSTMPISWQVFENHIDIQTYGPKQKNGDESKQKYVFPDK
jgi:hypothetical protein